MENIVSKSSSRLSKMWNKILNLENCLFPELKEQLGTLSTKEEKLIKILDFAQIEKYVTVASIWDFIYLYSSKFENGYLTLQVKVTKNLSKIKPKP